MIILVYLGVVSIIGLLLLWHYKVTADYFGFELISTCIRWYLKMTLFEHNNGMNYYFPVRLKSYILLIHVVLMTI